MNIWVGSCSASRLRFQNASGCEGFALIDMLVALVLAAILSSLMVVFLGQSRSLMRIERMTKLQMEADAAVSMIETTIQAAQPLALAEASSENTLYLAGRAHELEWVATLPTGFGKSSLRQISISLDEPDLDGQRRLQLVEKSLRSLGGSSAAVVVLNAAGQLRFEYLDETGIWLASWEVQRKLPKAIRFEILIHDGDIRYSARGFARLSLSGTASVLRHPDH